MMLYTTSIAAAAVTEMTTVYLKIMHSTRLEWIA